MCPWRSLDRCHPGVAPMSPRERQEPWRRTSASGRRGAGSGTRCGYPRPMATCGKPCSPSRSLNAAAERRHLDRLVEERRLNACASGREQHALQDLAGRQPVAHAVLGGPDHGEDRRRLGALHVLAGDARTDVQMPDDDAGHRRADPRLPQAVPRCGGCIQDASSRRQRASANCARSPSPTRSTNERRASPSGSPPRRRRPPRRWPTHRPGCRSPQGVGSSGHTSTTPWATAHGVAETSSAAPWALSPR